MNTLVKAIVIAVAVSFTVSDAFARPARWERIGSRTVNHVLDRDTIPVTGNDRHRQIRLCVRTRAVRFFDVDVVFGNGGRQDVSIRRVIAAGGCTRVIDLEGRARNITAVIMLYRSEGRVRRPAIVDVFAR
jgi:hypothetical protein